MMAAEIFNVVAMALAIPFAMVCMILWIDGFKTEEEIREYEKRRKRK